MRVLGFSKAWPKLGNSVFTTFRFPRKDRDWEVGEVVQIVLHPRCPQRQVLGVAEITEKVLRRLDQITEEEAIADGFSSQSAMLEWLKKTHGKNLARAMFKLTLQWKGESGWRRLTSSSAG